MKISKLVLICLIATALPTFSADLATYKKTYEKSMGDIVLSHGLNITKLNKSYNKSLTTLSAKVRSKGDLAKVKTVNAEIERFKNEKTVTAENAKDSFADLKKTQDFYIKQSNAMNLSKAKKIISLASKFDGALAKLQKNLTIQNKLDDATAVEEERKRVSSGEEVVAAKAIIEADSKKKALAKRVTKVAPKTKRTFAFDATGISGCVLWLKPDKGLEEKNGSVTKWIDQSDKKNHASPDGESCQPLYIVDAINGLSAVRFDGVDDNLEYPSLAAQTVFFVCSVGSSVQFLDGMFGFHNIDNGIRRQPKASWRYPGDDCDFSNPAGSTFKINGEDIITIEEEVWHIGEVYRSAGAKDFNRIGVYYNDRALPVDVAEVIIYRKKLTEKNRNAIGCYLSKKYGLKTSYSK